LTHKTQEEVRLTRYLLGQSSERELERTEEAYFTDDEAFEQLLMAEEELIDAYASGEMPREERERFEELFMASPRGRERVQFARSLTAAGSVAQSTGMSQEAERTPPPSLFAALYARGATLRFALAAVALAAVVGYAWLLVERTRMRNELRQLRDERTALSNTMQEMEQRIAAEQRQNEELRAQLESKQAVPPPKIAEQGDLATRQNEKPPNTFIRQPQPPSVLSFVLTPGLVRSGGTRTLSVPPGASSIVLRLNIESDSNYSTYHAVLETADGRRVWSANMGKSQRPAAALTLPALPAKNLPPDDYVLLLSGMRPDGGDFEDIADYSFRVVRK